VPQFTEEQLEELETLYGLKRIETLPIRDGVVARHQNVWWRGEDGPEFVEAGNPSHWSNIQNFPNVYQHAKPVFKLAYVD
jgi:hypothetical protein